GRVPRRRRADAVRDRRHRCTDPPPPRRVDRSGRRCGGARLMVVEATHLRADAQRNLERILEAARAVFAEEGLEASVADVARRAGVGTATIFRRFPTKDDLVAAMLEQELETIVARARAAADASDPAAAIAEFVSGVVEPFIEDRVVGEPGAGPVLRRT